MKVRKGLIFDVKYVIHCLNNRWAYIPSSGLCAYHGAMTPQEYKDVLKTVAEKIINKRKMVKDEEIFIPNDNFDACIENFVYERI